MSKDGNGVRVAGEIVLELRYDCVSFQVSIGGEPMALSLAQMIVDEGARVLAEQRRLAAAMQLQKQMQEQAHAQEIARRVSGRGN
jgi:hypothetical protein